MKNKAHLIAILAALALTGVVLPDAALALPALGQQQPSDSAASQSLGPEWVPLAAARLGDMRGGIDLPSGLNVSFGIERVVHVNGALVASTSLNIANLGSMTPEQASALGAISTPTVVQIGEGNTFDPAMMFNGGATGLVIQNTLNGQDIRALTIVNVGVDTLGMLQNMNSYAAMQNALLLAPGSP